MGRWGRGGVLRLLMVDWPLLHTLLWLGRFGSAGFEVGGTCLSGCGFRMRGGSFGGGLRWRSCGVAIKPVRFTLLESISASIVSCSSWDRNRCLDE